MKRLLFLALLTSLATAKVSAQASVTSVSYNKTSQPGLMIEMPYNEDVSEGFIIDNLKKTGYNPETKGKLFWKNNKVNGFYTFKGIRLESAPEALDFFFKVEPKSKRSKDQSVIYLLVAKGGENWVSSTSDEASYNAAKNFLNGFLPQAAVYKLDLDIKAQDEAVKSAEKKLQKLQDNQHDMEKKIDQLQKDLKKNKEDQEGQQKSIEEEKKKLEDLRSRKAG